MGAVIHMCPKDISLAERIGHERTRRDNEARCVDRRASPRLSSSAVSVIGCVGEIAFAKWAGVPFDTDTTPRSGGHDFYLENGLTVDVKTTTHPRGQLLVALSKRDLPRADRYVLAYWRQNGLVFLRGWTDDPFKTVDNTLPKPAYAVRAEILRSMEDFWGSDE